MARTVQFDAEGVRATMAAFRRLPREASKALRERSLELAGTLAGDVQRAARAEGAQAALMAPLVRGERERVPAVKAGGARRVGSRSTPAYALIFGAEFGSNQYTQFKPHNGTRGHFMFPTIRNNDEIPRAWQQVADDIARDFATGGGT